LNRRIKKFFSVYEFTDKSIQSASLYGWLPIERVKKLFKNTISFQPNQFLVNSLKNIPSESSMLNQMLYWDMKYFLTDHNLNYTDKMSMAHGVEVRVPFLDKELVEFSALIPPELKMKGNITKYILKKVGERYLPNEIIHRPKTGFGAPVRDWIIDRLDEKIAADLSQEVIDRDGIFNYSEIQKLLVQNKKGSVDASYSIWGLLAVNSWLKQFVNKEP
jgi:asparagine synthase (glutamine-hydrolysing)